MRERIIGTPLNRYHIPASIGAGAMGKVFRARDARLNRDVGVEVLLKDFATHAERLRPLQQESKTVAAVDHPSLLDLANGILR